MTPVIRPIETGDLTSYLACLDRVARERIYLAFTEAPTPEQARFFLDAMLKRGLPFYIAAGQGGDVVGWCDIFVTPAKQTRPGFDHAGTLGMGIADGHRGQGLGNALLKAALDHAGRCGIERVELQVYASNGPAIALYRKFGFETEGIRRRARKLDGHYDDILVMARLRPPTGGQ